MYKHHSPHFFPQTTYFREAYDQTRPDQGVQGEGEGGANGEGEVERHALAGQRLAEGQALGSQRGVTFAHFGLFLNNEKFE